MNRKKVAKIPPEGTSIVELLASELKLAGLEGKLVLSYSKYSYSDLLGKISENVSNCCQNQADSDEKVRQIASAFKRISSEYPGGARFLPKISDALMRGSPCGKAFIRSPLDFADAIRSGRAADTIGIFESIDKGGGAFSLFMGSPPLLSRMISSSYGILPSGLVAWLNSNPDEAEAALKNPEEALRRVYLDALDVGIELGPSRATPSKDSALHRALKEWLGKHGVSIECSGSSLLYDPGQKKILAPVNSSLHMLFHEAVHAFCDLNRSPQFQSALQKSSRAFDSLEKFESSLSDEERSRLGVFFGKPSAADGLFGNTYDLLFNLMDESRMLQSRPSSAKDWTDAFGHPGGNYEESVASFATVLAFDSKGRLRSALSSLVSAAEGGDALAKKALCALAPLLMENSRIALSISGMLEKELKFGQESQCLSRIASNASFVINVAEAYSTSEKSVRRPAMH